MTDRVVHEQALASGLLSDRAVAHHELLGRLAAPSVSLTISGAAAAIARSIAEGGTAFFCGNGGSAADAQHLVAELVGRFRCERGPLAAIALGSNQAVSSALSNDYGFAEAGLARELDGLARDGDVVVALSTSGRSPNILAALATARERGLATVALVGADHALDGCIDHLVVVPTSDVALIQEMHSVIGHVLCHLVETELGFA